MAQVDFPTAWAGLVAGNSIARAAWAPSTAFLKLFPGREDSAPMVIRVTPAVANVSPEKTEASGSMLVADMLASDWTVTEPTP